MRTPVITIVTVVLNGSRTLQETIESIIPQLTDEIEYLIIDGNSSDGTQDIIRSYTNHLAYWISEPDKGIYDAWNKGLARASGQYIGFVGADDVLLPSALSAYLAHIHQQPEIEYWSSRVEFGNHLGRIIGHPWCWDKFRRYMTVAHVGSLHRRDLYNRFGQYDINYRIAGDYEFLLRVGPWLKAGFIDQITAVMKDGGVSNRLISLALKEAAQAKLSRNATSPLITQLDLHTAKLKHLIHSLAPLDL